MAERDDDFLSRWSRRKGDAKTARLEEQPAGSDPVPGETDAAPDDQVPDEAEIVAQLPDIESLDKESDFSAFMKQGVPEALKRRALRKLWRLHPVFAGLDGMNDYDEDYSIAESIAEGVKTLYQVGKGMVREEEEEKPESEELAEADSAEESESGDRAIPEPEAEGEDGNVNGHQDGEIDSSDPEAVASHAPPTDPARPIDAVDREDRREPREERGDGKSGGRTASQRRWGTFQS